MGLCWSEPPPAKQVPVVSPYASTPCKGCGVWNQSEYCQACLQRNAMSYIKPTAPPYQTQYTYSYPPQQQQQQMYYYQPPVQAYPPQQRQMGTGTAIATGFVIGALMEDILDPTE